MALSPKLASVHNVFYVSMLKKYISSSSHVLSQELIEKHEDMNYEKKPIQILDRENRVLQNKVIPLMKVLGWNHKTE